MVRRPRLLITVIVFIFLYVASFYFFFVNQSRFLLLLFPLLAIIAGYGVASLAQYKLFQSFWGRLVLLGVVFLPGLAATIRFDQLLIRNDTRIQAREWLIKNIPEESKIAVLAPVLRVPTLPEAIHELETIDSSALRTIDHAERALKNGSSISHWYALNLSTAVSPNFFKNLNNYIQVNHYKFAIINEAFALDKGTPVEFLTEGAERHRIKGEKDPFAKNSFTNGYGDSWWQLFRIQSIGPELIIKEFGKNDT